MSEKDKHEPGPWILGGASGRMITTPDGYCGDGFIADVDTLANATRIVECVNSHDKLKSQLATLRGALEEISSLPDQFDEQCSQSIASDALKKCFGEKDE